MKVRPEHDKAGNIIRWCVDAGVAAGKRIRKRFPTKLEADLWAKENKSIKRTESVKTLSLAEHSIDTIEVQGNSVVVTKTTTSIEDQSKKN